MAKEFAGSFYTRSKWKKCRRAYIDHRIEVDGGWCEDCRKKLGYIVHHKVELTAENIDDPDVAYGWGNLKYVCHDCHNVIEHKRYGRQEVQDEIKYKFDGQGNIVPV